MTCKLCHKRKQLTPSGHCIECLELIKNKAREIIQDPLVGLKT